MLSTMRRRGGWRRLAAAAALGGLPAAACGGPDAGAVPGPGGPERPNIVWIVAETFTAEARPDAGAPAAAAIPDAFARTATVFRPAAARPAATGAARAALLTGIDPDRLGIDAATGAFTTPPAPGIAVLPEHLRRAGYYTSRRGRAHHALAVAAHRAPADGASAVDAPDSTGGAAAAAAVSPEAAAPEGGSGPPRGLDLDGPGHEGADAAAASAPAARRGGFETDRGQPGLAPDLPPAAAGPSPADLAQPGLLGAWDAAGPAADWRDRTKDWDYPCTVSFGCGGARSPGARPFFALFNLDPDPAGAAGGGPAGQAARILEELEADGLADDTVVFLIAAGGPAPTIAARWPGRLAAGAASDDPAGLLDLAPTALALAGAPVPAVMTGRVLVAPAAPQGPAPADAAGPAATNDAGAHAPRRTAPPPRGEADAARAGAAAASHPAGGPADHRPAASAVPAGAAPVDPAALAADGPPAAARPGGYPTGGLFHAAPSVELWCDTPGAAIVYTTEREAPFYWRLYTGPFRMRFWTLRAQCGRLGYRDSGIVVWEFDIE